MPRTFAENPEITKRAVNCVRKCCRRKSISSLRSRRGVQAHTVQAVVKLGAKAAIFYQGQGVTVGGCHESYVEGHFFGPAREIMTPSSKNRMSWLWRALGNICQLGEIQSAACCLLEAAQLACYGLVCGTEQLCSQQGAGMGLALTRTKGSRERGEEKCRVSASTSLPVPVSPVSSTGASEAARLGKQGSYPLYGRASAHKFAAAPCLLQALLQELYLGLVFNNIQVKSGFPSLSMTGKWVRRTGILRRCRVRISVSRHRGS